MKTIIEMAREAGLESEGYWEFDLIRFKRFTELVRADEREALIRYFNEHWRSNWSDGQIIEAIEARGNTCQE